MRLVAHDHGRPQRLSPAGPGTARASAHPVLHLQRMVGNRPVQRLLNGGPGPGSPPRAERASTPGAAAIAIDAPQSEHERHADRVAEQRMAPGHAPGGTPPALPRGAGHRAVGWAPASVRQVLSAAGRPLEPGVRGEMEQRFGQDFSRVRVHADGAAARSARDVGAAAYTVGDHVVFGGSRYAPATRQGRLLLAHELTHTLQQASMAGGPRLQRKCLADLGTAAPVCTPSQAGAVGWQLQFKQGCDELLPGEAANIDKIKLGWQVRIHGYASRVSEGPIADELSCHRANVVADMVRRLRGDCEVLGVLKHGASPAVANDPVAPSFWQSVVIEQVRPPFESGEQWLDKDAVLFNARAQLRRAKLVPNTENLDKVAAQRSELRKWLENVGTTLAPAGMQLTTRNMDDYRRFFDAAEQVWKDSDLLLAFNKHPDAAKDTYAAWATGKGSAGLGAAIHASAITTGKKYHVDLFGEGYYKGAINVGDAKRTTTTGVSGSRVPYPVVKHFSPKDATIPIADHSADLVTSENGPVRIPGLANEIARILAPGGTVILVNPLTEEFAHDLVIKAVGGTSSKVKKKEQIETTIVAPGP